MFLMKQRIIQLFCLLIIISCQNNDIDIYNGSDSSIDKLNGNWIVINYWADWCAPCIKEIPELNEFASENDDLLVYTFNFDQLDEEDLAPIAEKFNIQVPSLITHPRDIWGIQTPPAVPATFFINPKGKIVLSLFRPQTKDALNKIFSELKQAG
jgi:thiol-disulfide isomerase/thioredoxin|tara:strand:- start:528 stop:989 length:462 start_codon:yes stop_codon:yes gene_type:complete